MNIFITDTTLREGIQSASLELSYQQRKDIFFLLASAGVEEIEAGVPAHSEEERKYINELARSQYAEKLIVWNRANKKDLELAIQCNVKKVEIAFPISNIMIEEKLRRTKEYVISLAKELLPYVKAHGLYVSVGLEDVSRADKNFVFKFVDHIKELGADRIRLSDTIGLLNPIQVVELVRKLSSIIDVEVHFHNDFGMATANSIVAAFSGAKYINTSLLGLGERCGIAPIEEVVFYLEVIQKIHTGIDIKELYQVIKHVINIKGLELEPNKPLVGKNAFTSKSSIHIDGLLKSKRTYLPFDPEILGVQATLSYGTYSRKR
ncbi:MAG: homocitrate synthase [Aquificaceae bacterium]